MTETIEATPIEPAIPEAVNYSLMYEEQREENARLRSIMSAARISGVPTHAPGADRKPSITAEHVRRSVSPVAFLNMTRDQKIQSLGVDPATVTDGALKKLFGRSNDGIAAKDLHLSNPLQYRQLRECALILNKFGA
jgi:hypothetical protein